MGTVLEEADESAFWIELLVDAAKAMPQLAQPLLAEANELTAIAASSITPQNGIANNSAFCTLHSTLCTSMFLHGDGPSRTCYYALSVNLARLVSEERPKRRDDGHESGIYEVADHCLDVFVGCGSFFVEQVALFADYPAT